MFQITENKRNYCLLCACCSLPDKHRQQKYHNTSSPMIIASQEEQIQTHYTEALPKLSPGTCIHLHGFIKLGCSRFSVNLKVNKEDDSDIAVHINPRLSQRYMVRNSRQKGQWDVEETTSLGKFNLQRNREFKLNVFIAKKEFLISVNGRHTCGFVYRLPVTKVTILEVKGLVDVIATSIEKFGNYPQPSSQNLPYIVPQGDGSDKTVNNSQLAIPLTALLSNGFMQGWQLEIYGHVKLLPYGFYINLQEGAQLWPHPIVPLHLNPRFSVTQGKPVVVRNAWINGEWGAEECTPGVYFSPGLSFSIAIQRVTGELFSVWSNEKLIGEFKIRQVIDKIDTIYIHGDVIIDRIYMRENIDDKYCSKNRENISSLFTSK